MTRRPSVAAAAAVGSLLAAGPLFDRLARRMLRAPRRLPGEETLGPMVDALGGEVVRLRSRSGIRLGGRWLPVEAPEATPRATERASASAESVAPGGRGSPSDGRAPWRIDPREAILLLHGYSGSVAPDLVEYGPFLRRTANVLGLDFRGHGTSDDGPTTFGPNEVEDVAGALAWLGERGIARVALFGTSMGGMTAISAVAVLGDGRLPAADLDPTAPAAPGPPPRPQVVGVVADSAAPEIWVTVAGRLRVPLRGAVARRIVARAGRILGEDLRALEPARLVPLLEDLPLLLVHGALDRTVPLGEGRRIAAAAGPGARLAVIAGADHSAAHVTDPVAYETLVTDFLRDAFTRARTGHSS